MPPANHRPSPTGGGIRLINTEHELAVSDSHLQLIREPGPPSDFRGLASRQFCQCPTKRCGRDRGPHKLHCAALPGGSRYSRVASGCLLLIKASDSRWKTWKEMLIPSETETVETVKFSLWQNETATKQTKTSAIMAFVWEGN